MADEILAHSGEGQVDVQIGGPGNPWIYLSACAGMSGPTVPLGATELRWCQDPRRAGKFKKSSKIRTEPDQVSFDLTTKLGKINYLKDLKCPFTARARFANCGERENTQNYDPLMLAYCNSELQEYSYEDLVVVTPGDNNEIIVTAPVMADDEYRVEHISPTRIGTAATVGDQAINDIEYCDSADCGGYCGSRSDGCTTFYGVTDADATPYTSPNLIKGVKNLLTDVITWTVAPILGLNSNADGIECAGNTLIVISNGDSKVAYNSEDGDQDEWVTVSLANAPSPFHAALMMRTANEGYIGAAGGFVYKTVDAGRSWNAVLHSGQLTTQRINAVWAYDKDLVYAAGDSGVILKSTNGGQTWQDVTEVSTVASNILKVIVPSGRPKEVYVGAANGKIYRSTNEGSTFAAISFDGDGIGSVDDIDFCGPCGSDVMFILHNDAGPRGRILRDLSGGYGGADVEVVMSQTAVIGAGIDLNALACCDVNEVLAAGELNSNFPVIIQVS